MSCYRNCKPCTTCKIEICRKNRNPNTTMDEEEFVSKEMRNEFFRRKGCPYDYKNYSKI